MGGVTREKFLPKLILFQMAQALFCIGTITYQERLFSIITLAWPSSVASKGTFKDGFFAATCFPHLRPLITLNLEVCYRQYYVLLPFYWCIVLDI